MGWRVQINKMLGYFPCVDKLKECDKREVFFNEFSDSKQDSEDKLFGDPSDENSSKENR